MSPRQLKLKCPYCSKISTVITSIPAAQLMHGCICGHMFYVKEHLVNETSSDAARNKKRSKDQEKRAAKRYGGRPQAGSGALDHAKGDVRDKGISRGECKFTQAKSYSLKLDTLLKIESEAVGEEVPYLELEFQGTSPSRRFVILPDWAFQHLLAERKTNDGHKDHC